MGLGRILQRIGVVDRHVQFAVDDGREQGVGAFQQFRALADVVVEFRPGRKQRAVIVEFGDREWRHRTRGVAETDEQSARLEAGQRTRKRGLADAVIDDVAEFVAADLLDARDEILVVVEDDVIAAIGEREVGLRLGADGADDMGAERPRPLAGEQPDAAGGGVDQHPMVRLDLEGLVQQVPDRQPLQHQHRALLVGDMVGQLDQFVRRDVPLAGIAAEIEIIGDAVAGMKIGHAGPDRQNLAGGFIAGDERQSRRLVEAGAIIHVDEVQADGMLADANLADGPGAGTSTAS